MKRPPQTLHFGQLWTLFIDGNLNEHQDAELADWLARGGRIERGTIEDLDCHQLLRSAGHVARTENDFVCDLIEHLSPPTPSSKSEAQEADGHRSLDMPAAFAFRKSSVDQTPGNARPYRRLFAMLATAGSFLAVAALLYGLSSRTPAPTAQADTPPPRFDGTTAKRDLQDLETDPLTEPIEPLITVSTLAVPATTTNEPEAATDTDETIIAEASGETLGIEAQELEIIEEEAI